MSVSAVAGVFLKLSWLVLKICKWVLVNMSMNCKFSGFSGRVPAAFKLKKPKKNSNGANFAWTWKKMLLSLCVVGVIVGSLMFSLRLKAGVWKGKGETPKLFQGKSGFYLKHFNVSMGKFLALVSLLSESDQIASLEHAKKLFEKAPRNDIACSLKVKCVEEELDYHGGWFAENHKHMDRCTLRQLELFLPGEKSKDLDNIDENVMQAKVVKDYGEAHCERCSFCFVNLCCWVLLGVIATYKFSLFLLSSWRKRNEKPMQEQPTLPQQPKKLTQQKKQEHTGNWRKNLLALFVFLGLMASVGIFFYISANIVLRRKETLINMCDQRARMLQDQFNVSMNHVNSLALLVSTFHHGKNPSAIDQQTFREYTERTAFERPLTSGVAYALKVSHSEREHFEKQHGWTIKKMENEDQTLVQDCNTENLDPSPVRDEYAPVIFSQETVSHIVSIDMMSGREDRENILRARASGKGVLTSPFKLLKSNHLGVVLTFAVYKPDLCPDATPEQRIQATVGYLGASYDVPSLVEKLLHQLASKQAIVVNVYDTTNASAPINMYGTEVVVDTGLSHTNHIDFGDPSRKHEMICRFKEKPPLPWVAIFASVGIGIITLLLGHIFLVAINRIAKVELDFQKMMELKVRAEAADVAKSQFLATVSHEIRTPMNGVLGMLQMLMDTDLDANQLDFAQTAHDSGKDLISLINEVLDQAKIESGRLELEAVPFDLRDVLDHVLSLFSGRYHEKGIEMAVYVSEQVPEVVIGDPGRFRQIIANLVGNSIKFTQNKGHIFVSVHLAAEAGDQLHPKDEVMKQGLISVQDRSNNTNDTLSGLPVVDRWKSWKDFKNLNEADFPEEPKTIKLLVTVEDTGIGICHDAQCRIFTPFMQADSSTSRKYGGTGIGLSISKRLVGLMCGEIGFVSEPGIGSTFSFTIALRKGERSSLDTKRQAFDPAISEFWGWQTLVVDERRVRAEVTKYHLQRLGIHVDTVSSLKSACSYLSSTCNTSSSQLAVIAVDEEAWERDTDQAFQHLIQQLRRNGSTRAPNILAKIFLLTNCSSPRKHIEISSTSVVDDVLLKPLRLSVLIACFQGVLGIGKKRQLSRCKTNLKNLLKEKRILVVDDNLVNQKVAAGALKKHGAFVTCVSSGRDALRKLKPPHNFDACFMDLQMPEMDGFQATKSIRSMENEINAKIESNPGSIEMSTKMFPCHTPILAMTADVIQATNAKCMMYGMDGYVSKPFEEDQLYSAVARFFESTS